MSGIARSLVGLEHSVAEGIGLGQSVIRLHVRSLHILVLGVGRATAGAQADGQSTSMRSAPSMFPLSYIFMNAAWAWLRS